MAPVDDYVTTNTPLTKSQSTIDSRGPVTRRVPDRSESGETPTMTSARTHTPSTMVCGRKPLLNLPRPRSCAPQISQTWGNMEDRDNYLGDMTSGNGHLAIPGLNRSIKGHGDTLRPAIRAALLGIHTHKHIHTHTHAHTHTHTHTHTNVCACVCVHTHATIPLSSHYIL